MIGTTGKIAAAGTTGATGSAETQTDESGRTVR